MLEVHHLYPVRCTHLAFGLCAPFKYATYTPEIIVLHMCVCDKIMCFNIKVPANQYRISHYKDATVAETVASL